jgi:exodeoxyribonuclease VII large subunit
MQARLRRQGTVSVERLRTRLRFAERALNSVSPLATLTRGYSIVTDADTGRVLTDAARVASGTVVNARLARGRLRARVTETEKEPGADG